MGLKDRVLHTYTELTEQQAEKLRSYDPGYTVEVKPPRNSRIPATLDSFIHNTLEYQTKWFGLRNASPTISFEIRRSKPERLRFQFTVPTKRLERKVRTQLSNQIPGIKLGSGQSGIPVTEGDTVGGGILSTGRQDAYPLKTEYDEPPANSITSELHRHAMQDTKVIIQILFQPNIGKPLRQLYWRKRSHQRSRYLRKEKEKIWGYRQPTPREKKQAKQIERKVGTPRFTVTIRILTINAGKHTPSRIKELSGPFNIYESLESGQYLNTTTITPLRETRILNFAKAIATRKQKSWTQSFQASAEELAALVTIPDIEQKNLNYAQP